MRYQVLRPPYCYRWAVLISIVLVTVSLIISLSWAGAEGTPAGSQPPSAQPVQAAPGPQAPAAPAHAPVRTTARQGRFVALTFDDGPDPAYTPQILDLLAQHGAVATFCMVGTQVRRHPELVAQVVRRGMRLCDHTVSHDEQLARRNEARISADITGAQADLRLAADGDVAVPYFRAPGGNWSETITTIASRAGMTPLGWSVDSRDWTLPGAPAIVATVEQAVQPGAVILLHDGGGQRGQTVDALAELLPWLVGQGYQFDFPAT
ncbi:polysaccharide deacetylase family protein [Amycolatopsis thermophila]|uniref:Peptidoglycan/xylan/chitin deacetylase (PgdA/CDA1 family) n=1 Tax=Amycolatopsis thermophila TaxID=206084 RepID=A0ABU0EZM4_9PSEU|nr:polysaccharide deacetylase family protein [Amycolatopsis thermophila]MDQ0380588.1 peptidoglycan/xylan/chitin deacetylase (PgdA/CDA1 family) [Amycolatopsis thermophila]